MIKKSLNSIRKLLSWYLNGNLSSKEHTKVLEAISQDTQTHSGAKTWELLRKAMLNQPFVEPSLLVQRRIMVSIHESSSDPKFRVRMRWRALAGVMLTLLSLIILWLVVRPGVVLQWSIDRDGIASYRIYRASQGSSKFELLKEIPGQVNRWQYRFVDALLMPGKDYIYRVEGIRLNGVSIYSQDVMGRSLDLLPGQLALFITSVIIGYGLVLLMQRLMSIPERKVMKKIT